MEAAETSWRSLGELFVERGLISEADLERALAEQTATKTGPWRTSSSARASYPVTTSRPP